jgi:hypothetical protein
VGGRGGEDGLDVEDGILGGGREGDPGLSVCLCVSLLGMVNVRALSAPLRGLFLKSTLRYCDRLVELV